MRRWFPSLLLLPALLASAEQTEVSGWSSSAPITIEADRLELDQKAGSSHYQGNVVLKQGGLQIKADSITLYLLNKQLRQAIAMGNPATLQQDGGNEAEPIRAEAQRMEYLPQSEEIKLSGSARLWRGGNAFSGEQISYHLAEQMVRATGDKKGEGRVRVLLLPPEEPPTANEEAPDQP